ncbi:MAG TPA: twin-arginine translocation signal domain-containing protein [Pyrinomonadaceae bacterium]|jgi:protocatechuate 3,4-dioxygenase beta subunit
MRENRRSFIKRAAVLAAALPAASLGAWAVSDSSTLGHAQSQDWRGAADAPAHVSWRTVITSPDERGEPLVMSGRIFQADARTPAAGILLYVYHTDATGYYNHPNRMPARLRGWMRTGADGRYEFRTIKPAPYPNRDFPAHIHPTLSGPGYPEMWFDEFWFAGDPLITPAKRALLSGRGGFNPIVTLTRGADGVLYGQRDIRLERL